MCPERWQQTLGTTIHAAKPSHWDEVAQNFLGLVSTFAVLFRIYILEVGSHRNFPPALETLQALVGMVLQLGLCEASSLWN